MTLDGPSNHERGWLVAAPSDHEAVRREADFVLDRLAAIDRALAETEDIAQVIHLREAAEMLRYMARKAELGIEVQNAAAKSRIDAERRAGEILKAMPKHKGGRPPKNHPTWLGGFADPRTYQEIGVTDYQADRWQTLASLPEEEYEGFVVRTILKGYELTSAAVYRYAQNWHNVHVLTSSESNEWYTPAIYVDAARAVSPCLSRRRDTLSSARQLRRVCLS